mgnify:CR=1 FL=1|tara:strand:+ start:14676 stop:14921 length:246 start_codon:yes stop_codon:yes gene_type:complete
MRLVLQTRFDIPEQAPSRFVDIGESAKFCHPPRGTKMLHHRNCVISGGIAGFQIWKKKATGLIWESVVLATMRFVAVNRFV